MSNIDAEISTLAATNNLPKRWYKSKNDRWLYGVIGGLAKVLGVDSNLLRTIFIIIGHAGGIGITAYFLLAMYLPDDPSEKVVVKQHGKISILWQLIVNLFALFWIYAGITTYQQSHTLAMIIIIAGILMLSILWHFIKIKLNLSIPGWIRFIAAMGLVIYSIINFPVNHK